MRVWLAGASSALPDVLGPEGGLEPHESSRYSRKLREETKSVGWLGHLQNAKILAKVAEMIERMPELRTLSPSDKLALVTELWDDLASNPEDIPITPEQIAEVDRRLEEYRKNPDLGSTWEEVKARILGQNR